MSSSTDASAENSIAIDSSKIPTTADTSPATYFDYSDISDTYWDSDSDWFRTKKSSYYEHLAKLNQGKKVSAGRYNTRYETYMLNKDLMNALSSQLGLTRRQKSLAQKYFRSLDLEMLGLQAEHVAYSVCQYVVHTDEGDERTCHPHCRVEDIPDEFKRVRDSIRLLGSTMVKTYGKVRHELAQSMNSTGQTHDANGLGRRCQNESHK